MDFDDDDDDDFGGDDVGRAIFSYLLRRGHIRIVNRSTALDTDEETDDHDDDDDSDFCIEENEVEVDRSRRKRKADLPQPKKTDTSRLKESEFYQYIQRQSGQKLNSRGAGGLLSSLRERQLSHVGDYGGFSPPKKAAVASRYLPNTKMHEIKCSSKRYCGTFSRNGDVYVSASQDQHIRLYDVTSNDFTLFKDIEARDVGWTISDTDFSPDQNYLIYSSWCDSIYLCNIRGEHDTHIPLLLRPPSIMHFCPFSIRFSRDNQEILAGGNDGFVYIYNRARNDRTVRFFTGLTNSDGNQLIGCDVNAVAFADESSQIIFSGADDGLVIAWDRRTLSETNPEPVGVLVGHSHGLTFIDPKGDGRHLISNSKDQSIKLWDIRKFCSSREKIYQAKDRVVRDKWDYRWQKVPRHFKIGVDVAGDTSLMTYRGHEVTQTLVRCRFSPMATTGQRYIYCGSSQGKTIIYDVLTGEIVSAIGDHKSLIRDVSWHPYHPILCTSSFDGTVGWWEYRNNQMDDGEA
ncbi:DDB1- and CUL4-associated factor 11-like [Oscarella lobularis]|uniref:DDB1- and CUL4-associated factor 11-like n=1 Tax=Oscarella lobularis TaxID=121494 RepID=UPI0033144673